MPEQTALAVPEELDDDALALVVEVEELVVNSQETFEYAATLRKLAKDMIATLEGRWKPLKQAQDAAKRKLLDQEQADLAMPKKVLGIVNDKLAAYETAQRREKQIAEARAAQEARAIEAARPKPEPGAPPPMPVVVPAAPVEMPKVAGLGFRTYWRLEETSRTEFIAAVAAKKFGSPMCLEPNLPMLNDIVRAAKGQIVVPGFRIHEERRPQG
jgi:hypothetical protein